MKIDFQQIEYYDATLRALLAWLEDSIGVEFTNTSNARKGDGGVHGTVPVRGWDIRMRVESIGISIQDYINEHWQYDSTRPELKCCLLHGSGYNQHLHIQVHPNTRKIK